MWFFDFLSNFISFFLVGLGLLGMYLFKNTKPDFSHVKQDFLCLKRPLMRFLGKSKDESGSVFLAIFGAIAMVAILGTSVMTFMKGPLSTSVRLTKMNTAENQMAIGAQVAVMATASQANNGDCETAPDGFVEPIEWRTPTTEPIPTGGGLVPSTLGISKKDPWGTEYGYCVWNHGPVTSGAGCGVNMLAGTNSTTYPVVALISAGPDKTFTTTCRSFAAADVTGDGDLLDATDLPVFSKAAETDDDIITSFTYNEATGASGGLWSLKSGEPGTAVIGKNIETTGVADLKGGVLLPDKSFIDCTDVANTGVMAKSSLGIEICDGSGVWTSIGGASGALSTSAACTAPADAGNVRFDSVSGKPEFCDGTGWVPFTLSSPTGSLVISPASNYAMNITGPCSGGDCPFGYSTWVTFTVTNQGLTATPVLSLPTITGGNPSNFEFDLGASTCDDGIALAPANTSGNSCIIRVRAKTSGNASYSAQINVMAGALGAVAPLYGVGTLFTCGSGTQGWGGIVVGTCTGSGGTAPGTDQLIVQRAGCGSGTYEPACSDAPSADPQMIMASAVFIPDVATSSLGSVNSVTTSAYGKSLPSIEYCDNLVKDGFDDWYLPSYVELQAFYADPVIRTTFRNNVYWASTYSNYGDNVDKWRGANPNTGFSDPYYYQTNSTLYVRCARRHDATAAAVINDDNPYYLGSINSNALSVSTSYTPNLNSTIISQTLQVTGFNTPITASVSGIGTPLIRVNGGAWATSVTLNPAVSNSLIELQVTSPATTGAERAVTVTIGADTGVWKVRTYDSTIVKNIFVTSIDYNGNLGGLNGANNLCRTRANFAGLVQSGTYQAFITTSGNTTLDNIGWNWGTIQNLGVASVVASSPAALVAGTLSSAPNRTEFGVLKSSDVWGGTGYLYYPPSNIVEYTGSTGYNCTNWTSTSGSGTYGQSGQTNQYAFAQNYSDSKTCTTTLPIYCVGPNPDLPNITCPGAVDVTASKIASGMYNITVPANCAVIFKLWGGAGGIDTNCNGAGGGGGYVEFSETPTVSTTYFYSVGGRGATSGAGGSGATGFEGGAGVNTVGSGGGGASVLWRNSATDANILAVAAGGGGNVNQCGATGVKAGGQSGNMYSTSSTSGQIATCGAGNKSGGGGGGYDGSTGGGGVGGNCAPGSGGQNWVTSGMGITSSTQSGSTGVAGNYSDADISTAFSSINYVCCTANYSPGSGYYGAPGNGAVIVKY